MVGMLVLAWDMYLVPLGVFDPPDDSTAWVTIKFFCSVYWLLDIPAGFLVGYFDKYGILVMNFGSISRKYIRLWFPFDVTLVCLDWSAIILSDKLSSAKFARIVKLLRLIRSIRMVRLFKASKLKDVILACEHKFDSHWIDPVSAMLINSLIILVVVHCLACFWYWVGTHSHDSWVHQPGMRLHERGFAGKYLETFLLALHLFLGKPTGIPILPTTPVGEIVFIIVMDLVGLMVFSTFVGGVTSRLTKIRELIAKDKTQMFHLKEYLRETKVSMSLKERIISYVDFTRVQHKRCRSTEDIVLLSMLSGPLHVELQAEVFKPYLKINPMFREYVSVCNAAFGQVCYSCITEHNLGRYDNAFTKGQDANEMFLVRYGVLSYRMGTSTDARAMVVRRGYWCCEGVLWVPWEYKSRMKALIETDMIGLNGKKFRDATKCHPQALAYCRGYAIKFMEEYRKSEDARWDVPHVLIHPEKHEEEAWLQDLRALHNANPMGLAFSRMVSKAEELASMHVNETHDGDSDLEEEKKKNDGGFNAQSIVLSAANVAKEEAYEEDALRVTVDSKMQ
jgi:hypothetical protein